MTNLLKDFMASMEIPEQYGSTASKNIYHVVATKEGNKLGASLTVTNLVVQGNKPALGLILRFMEVPATEWGPANFTGFEVRQKDEFKRLSDGKKINAFRGEKHVIPVAELPISGYEFHQLLAENNIVEQLSQFIKERVKLAGGEVNVNDVTMTQVLFQQLDSIPHNKAESLFKLPTIKGYNDEPTPPTEGADGEQ